MQTIISTTLILIGAGIMLGSIIKSRELLKFAPLISERRRSPIVFFLVTHRALMTFFLLGYVVVALAFFFDLHLVGQLFVGVVFFFGAAFVFMGILIQNKMLLEIESTFHGILPVCSRCKKIRVADNDPDDRKSWIPMEAYLFEKTDARSFCPECLDELYGLPAEMRSEDSAGADSGNGGGD
jgi:hypothetical protein